VFSLAGGEVEGGNLSALKREGKVGGERKKSSFNLQPKSNVRWGEKQKDK